MRQWKWSAVVYDQVTYIQLRSEAMSAICRLRVSQEYNCRNQFISVSRYIRVVVVEYRPFDRGTPGREIIIKIQVS